MFTKKTNLEKSSANETSKTDLNSSEKEVLRFFRYNEKNNTYKILSVSLKDNNRIYIKIQSGNKGNPDKNVIKFMLDEKEVIQLSKTLEVIHEELLKSNVRRVSLELNLSKGEKYDDKR